MRRVHFPSNGTASPFRDQTYLGARFGAGELEERGPNDQQDYDPVVVSRVYVLLDRETCQVKIGYTERSAVRRQREHERQRGRKLELLGEFEAGYDLERCLHSRFSKYRREGHDWYSSEILVDLLPMLEDAA